MYLLTYRHRTVALTAAESVQTVTAIIIIRKIRIITSTITTSTAATTAATNKQTNNNSKNK